MLEGYEEHHVVDEIMGELDASRVTDETWGAKFKVMKENIEHHIEEEEGEMFKTARCVFDRSSRSSASGCRRSRSSASRSKPADRLTGGVGYAICAVASIVRAARMVRLA